MKRIVVILVAAALAGCGADNLGAAATGAALKKQELEQGKKTMEQAQQKIGAAMALSEERAKRAGDDGVK